MSAPERLSSSKLISQLFSEGKSVSANGFTLLYFFGPLPSCFPAQVAFVAPKRVFKKAVDRNYAKRVMREAYRQQKIQLYEWLLKQHTQAALLFICKNAAPNLPVAQAGISRLIQKIVTRCS